MKKKKRIAHKYCMESQSVYTTNKDRHINSCNNTREKGWLMAALYPCAHHYCTRIPDQVKSQ